MTHELSRPSTRGTSLPEPDPLLDGRTARLLDRAAVRAAAASIRSDRKRTLEEQIRLASTPAPPFQEERRGRLMAELLRRAGAGEPWTDEVGNVLAWIGESGPRPVVVAAHLDTVFPPEQAIEIVRDGDRWVGPGVSDDARGLAVLLSLVRVLAGSGPGLEVPLLAAATVGEEGVGNLRGVRHLFGPEGRFRDAVAFISLDGAGSSRVVTGGVGSRRFRARVSGPGGHSWVDWGRVNPLALLTESGAAFGRMDLPPGSTFNLGRMGGGTSVNSIPTEAWMEYEFRSEEEAALESLESRMRETLQRVVDRANAGAPEGEEARLELDRIGVRPAGGTDPREPLVRAAVAATRAVNGDVRLSTSSTDANYPMLRGIPAVTLGAGGQAGLAHTPREWYRDTDGPDGTLRAFLTLHLLDDLLRE